VRQGNSFEADSCRKRQFGIVYTDSWLFFSGSFLVIAARTLVLAEGHADSAGLEFFEGKIRPCWCEHCYSCHSEKAEKLKGGLYLDSRDGTLKGGDNGPAIVPGDPEKEFAHQSNPLLGTKTSKCLRKERS
jgi:hypothetical protein